MMKDNAVYLRHMLDAIGHITDYTQGVSVDQFMSRKLLQDGVVRELEIVGEASRNLSSELREKHPEVPWGQIISMRNRMIHAYFDVNLRIVWDIVQNDLPLLRQQIEQILGEG